MKLQKITSQFLKEIDNIYSAEKDNHQLNDKLLKLFQTFQDEKNEFDVKIKVAALNKIYSTAITNIDPVVQKIVSISKSNSSPENKDHFVRLVDEISTVTWINQKKDKQFQRNNLSFCSKYVHFLSGFKTPIYDSYIWIIMKGYIGQNNGGKISFKNPKDFKEFNEVFERFKVEFGLGTLSTYQIDKFLWQYGKTLITDISQNMSVNLGKSKTELKDA